VNCQLYSGWRLGKRKPGVITDGEGLVETAGESITIWGVGFRRGVGVSAREGDSVSVVDLCDEIFPEEAVGLGEGGSSYVGEGGSYVLSKGKGSGVGSGGEETSGGQGEGRRGFDLVVPVSRYLCSRGSFCSFPSFCCAGAGRLRIRGGGGHPRSVVRVECGMGEN